MAITIDTHAAIQKLEAAGADPKLAEAIVRTVSQADADLVTKADLKAELARLRSDLKQRLIGYERRLIGYLVAAVVIILGAIKYL